MGDSEEDSKNKPSEDLDIKGELSTLVEKKQISSNIANRLENKLIENVSVKQLLDLKDRTSVDKFLPKMILKSNLDCYVVNGKHPERVRQILKNKDTICTHITK